MDNLNSLTKRLWDTKTGVWYLLVTSLVLIFAFLGTHDIWTQEHRWADIVSGMFYRKDFLHPYLGEVRYYDKPLLSYWLIAALAKISGVLNTTILRLPSACAAFLSVWSIYNIGRVLKNEQLGLTAGWLLVTTFYFLFWARVSSADMLNVGGCLFAISWYLQHRTQQSFFNYMIFFCTVALTCLCKGLVGAVIVFMAVGIDILLQNTWRKHLNLQLLLGLLPAVAIYLLPFWLSSHFDNGQYGDNGLYLVYKENILRFFKPFDHKGPIYTYFLYLPIYTLPSAVFLIPALISLRSRWASMTKNSKWIVLSLLALFLFFTISGSRRSYYVLPLVPFAILFMADWLQSTNRYKTTTFFTALSFILLFAAIDLVPAWFYSNFGINVFVQKLQEDAQPFQKWNIVLLDAEPKLNFYLNLPPQAKNFDVLGKDRISKSNTDLAEIWPILTNKPQNTIFISRKLYADGLKKYFIKYHMVEVRFLDTSKFTLLKKYDSTMPIAFIPNTK